MLIVMLVPRDGFLRSHGQLLIFPIQVTKRLPIVVRDKILQYVGNNGSEEGMGIGFGPIFHFLVVDAMDVGEATVDDEIANSQIEAARQFIDRALRSGEIRFRHAHASLARPLGRGI
jgi:hypothetical protein